MASLATSLTDGDLNRRGWQRRVELACWQQRRLCHETRALPPVRLRGVNQEWMAEINGPCRTDCQFNVAIFRRSVTVGRDLLQRCACIAIGQQLPGDGGVRTFPYLRWRILRAYAREQEEHQQCASAALHIDAPLHEIRIIEAETHVHMPAIITRGFR